MEHIPHTITATNFVVQVV